MLGVFVVSVAIMLAMLVMYACLSCYIETVINDKSKTIGLHCALMRRKWSKTRIKIYRVAIRLLSQCYTYKNYVLHQFYFTRSFVRHTRSLITLVFIALFSYKLVEKFGQTNHIYYLFILCVLVFLSQRGLSLSN